LVIFFFTQLILLSFSFNILSIQVNHFDWGAMELIDLREHFNPFAHIIEECFEELFTLYIYLPHVIEQSIETSWYIWLLRLNMALRDLETIFQEEQTCLTFIVYFFQKILVLAINKAILLLAHHGGVLLNHHQRRVNKCLIVCFILLFLLFFIRLCLNLLFFDHISLSL
jgi:hypothetical protein